MLQFLLANVPACIVAEIALFEGRVLRAYLRDYVCQVYAHVYKRYFGYRYTLRTLCGGQNFESWAEKRPLYSAVRDTMGSLPFYVTWSTAIRLAHPEFVKSRVPRRHMRPYVGLVPTKRLTRERTRIEVQMAHYIQGSRI